MEVRQYHMFGQKYVVGTSNKSVPEMAIDQLPLGFVQVLRLKTTERLNAKRHDREPFRRALLKHFSPQKFRSEQGTPQIRWLPIILDYQSGQVWVYLRHVQRSPPLHFETSKHSITYIGPNASKHYMVVQLFSYDIKVLLIRGSHIKIAANYGC